MYLSTYLLLIYFVISQSLHASGEDSKYLEEGSLKSGGYPGGISFGPINKKETISPKDYPKINITLAENNKILPCNLDQAVNVYICANGSNPLLVKYSVFGFSALGRNPKDNTAKEFQLASVDSNSKTLFENKIYFSSEGISGYGVAPNAPINTTTDFSKEYNKTALILDNFFDLGPKLPGNKPVPMEKGSPEYEKIASSFIKEKEKLKSVADEISRSKNYQVELQDGTKLNCERGGTKTKSEQEIAYDSNYRTHSQCGVFKCSPITIKNKQYQATLLYDSNTSSMLTGSIHLSDKDGIGPSVSVRKITSPLTPIPMVDNSYFLDNPNFGGSYVNAFRGQALPQSMKQDKNEYTFFKDPGVLKYQEFYQQICTDEDGVLSNLISSKNKLFAKLAELELVQFIQLVGDNKLMGQYLSLDKARGLGCLYDGVYLDSAATKQLEKVKKNLHPDRIVQTISIEKARELFKKATKMDDIAFGYEQDGCYARAHLMARRFEKEGIRVDKVWIKGDLYVPETVPLVEWNFHVAPMVYVEDKEGKIQKIVIDPSLFDRPVTVDEWDKKISKKTIKGSSVTAFPFPENANFFERSAIAFSSSDPYLPGESINTSEAEKMKTAEQTMKQYKPLEQK